MEVEQLSHEHNDSKFSNVVCLQTDAKHYVIGWCSYWSETLLQ